MIIWAAVEGIAPKSNAILSHVQFATIIYLSVSGGKA
jgi:hypothetical protein